MRIKNILSSPLAFISASAIGVVAGVFKPGIFNNWKWTEEIVFGLIQMTVLPIILVSLLLSVSKLFHSRLSSRVLMTVIFSFIGPLFLVGTLAGTFAYFTGPSEIERTHLQKELGNYLESSIQRSPQTLADKVEYIPTNIFHALAEGNLVGLLTFIFLFGAALGLNIMYSGSTFVKVLLSINEALLRMFNWFLTFLSVAIMISVSETIEHLGLDLITYLKGFFITFSTWVFFFVLTALAVAKYFSKMPLTKFLVSVKQSLSISFFSGSNSSALPSLMETLKEKFKIDTWIVDLIAPLSLSAFKLGTVAFLAMLSVLMCQLFEIQITMFSFFMIVLASILQSICGGGEGAAAVMVLAFVLRPLGLPEDVMVMLVIALRPVLSFGVAVMNTASSLAIIISTDKWMPKKLNRATELAP